MEETRELLLFRGTCVEEFQHPAPIEEVVADSLAEVEVPRKFGRPSRTSNRPYRDKDYVVSLPTHTRRTGRDVKVL